MAGVDLPPVALLYFHPRLGFSEETAIFLRPVASRESLLFLAAKGMIVGSGRPYLFRRVIFEA